MAGTTCVVQFTQSGFLTNFALSNTVTVSAYTYTPGDTLRMGYRVPFDYVGLVDVYDLNFPAETTISPVPEPASLGMLTIGAAGLLLRRRRATSAC